MASPAPDPSSSHAARRWSGSTPASMYRPSGAVYCPRRPTETPLYPVVLHYLETFLAESQEPTPWDGGSPHGGIGSVCVAARLIRGCVALRAPRRDLATSRLPAEGVRGPTATRSVGLRGPLKGGEGVSPTCASTLRRASTGRGNEGYGFSEDRAASIPYSSERFLRVQPRWSVEASQPQSINPGPS